MNPVPETMSERIVWKALIWTWPFYALGALYVVGPVLAWVLAGLAAVALYFGPLLKDDLQPTGGILPMVWLWIVGMLVMLVALWAGHLDWGLGTKQTIKSSIGWAKGWALLALFPIAGSILPIRREVLIRAQGYVALCTLILAPILLAAPYVGLPERVFTSPLKAVGGPGPEYFTLYFFTYDPASWTPRWQFYAPWSPFAALLGVLTVLFALEEKNKRWMAIGIAAGVLMIFASKSRMGLVGLVACTMGPRLIALVAQSWAWAGVAALSSAFAIWGNSVINAGKAGVEGFKSARADSTRVRETLQRIAYERWQNDAVWFGHGTVRPGAHLVEYMPIGSHHTWYGLLFVKGLLGFAAFLVPFVVTLAFTTFDAVRHPRGRLPMGICMTYLLLSFGENIEIEAYLLWPSLLILGIHFREVENARLANMQPEMAQGQPLGLQAV